MASPGTWLRRGALVLWELPQDVLGAALLGLQWARGEVRGVVFDRERVFIEMRTSWAVSLGLFVFWCGADSPFVSLGDDNRAHEYGHSIQSRWLGPLYLPVVGVPSVSRVIYAILHLRLRGRPWTGYYDGFPEDWADRLGGVRRPTSRPRRPRRPKPVSD